MGRPPALSRALAPGPAQPATHKETPHVSFAYRPWAAFAVLSVLLASPVAHAQDRVIAKVNGKTITESDMKLAEAEIGSDLGSLPDTVKRRVVAEFLIENQLFADAAEGQKLGSGASFDERMQYWRRRALRDAYFERSVRNSVSDDEAKKFYDSRVGAAKGEEEVRARHILVDSKEKARELFELLAHGSDFAQLAKQHSKDPGSKDQGGELGFFARGQMVPQFEEVAFNLKKGEVGQPFETQFGWHIVRVDDRRQRAAPPFEAVKDRVMADMIHKKAQQIAADLRSKARIEYIDAEIKRSVESDRPGGQPKQ
jgi:peptidyl-prolyl cis-trans isomerase C